MSVESRLFSGAALRGEPVVNERSMSGLRATSAAVITARDTCFSVTAYRSIPTFAAPTRSKTPLVCVVALHAIVPAPRSLAVFDGGDSQVVEIVTVAVPMLREHNLFAPVHASA
jgi:hypothetical protein